ncbi:MAG: universal stress protein [Chitinophagaceae bacterium]|nr:MAG: universal stress protein [Chitinophagaceae bacterium]
MKRILVIEHAHHPNTAIIDFACRLADARKARFCGILMESMFAGPVQPEPAAAPSDPWVAAGTADVRMDPERAVQFFLEECERHGQEAEAEFYQGAPIPHVIRESSFADLILLDPATSFGDPDEQAPSHFTRSLLREAHCPVLLAPTQFEGVNETVFCYDGSASSIMAARLYTYLLPNLAREKATVLEVGKPGRATGKTEHRSLLKWMHCHYSDVTFESLEGTPDEELFRRLQMKRNKMVVMGAFGRSLLSTWARPSTAEKLIHNVDLPFFIAHV